MGGSTFSSIQVLLTGNNSDLKMVLAQSSAGIAMFDKTVAKSNVNLSKSGNILGKTLAGGALAAGAALIYAVDKAVAFDKAMRNVNSLAGLGEKGFAALEQRVISMSTKLPQSALTLAEGLYDIQSSGFSGADAMQVLEASALSASAGLTTTEVSAKAISATLNAYGLQAKDAADVSDVLFQTVNAGVISFDELAGNLGDVVGGAAAAKVSIDQVGSAIAAMTLAGISGAESTTSLNALIQKIVKPSKALASEFANLGYESGAQALEIDGLRGVMEKLRQSTGGNVTTLLQLFPEIRAARGAFALMANDGKNYARAAGEISDKTARAGSTQRVFNEQMKAASNQWTLLKNQIDAQAITIGTKLLPALTSGMDAAHDFGVEIGNVLGLLQSQFGSGIGDAVSILEDLWHMLNTVADALWNVGEPVAKLALGTLAVTLNLVMAAIEPLTSMLSENEAAVIALAVAWAIFSAGGVARIGGQVGAAAVLALSAMLEGLMALQGGLVAARAAAVGFIAAVGPLAAIALLVYGAVSAWQGHTEAVKETKDALDGLDGAMKTGTLRSLQDEVDGIKKMSKARKEAIDEYDAGSTGLSSWEDFKTATKNVNPARWGDVFKVGEYKDAIGDIEEGAKSGEASLNGFAAGIASLATDIGLIDPKKMQELMQGVSDGDPAAITELDDLLGQITPKMDDAGVSARVLQQALRSVKVGEDGTIDTGSLEGMREALRAANEEADSGAAAQKRLEDSILAASNGMGDAETAAKGLDDALNSLMGAAIGVDKAGIEWRQGLADLKAALLETKGGIDGNSLAAGKNRLAVQDQVAKMQDLLVAQAKNGAGSKELTRSLMSSRDALIATGRAAGIPEASMKRLLRQYNLTPDLIATIIKETGGDDVKAKLRALQREADKLGAKRPKIGIGVLTTKGIQALADANKQADLLGLKRPKVKADADAKGAQKDLEKLNQTADDADKKDVDIPTSAPGADSVISQLDQARQAALRLDGMQATVTTVHRDVKKNADGSFIPPGASRLPGQATIKPGTGGGLVQWAEGETGGEAFIPLGANKRAQSTSILEQVAAQFGLQLLDPMEGLRSYANGGIAAPKFSFHFKDFRFRAKGKKEKAAAYAKEKAQAKREYEKEKRDARFQAVADFHEEQRIYAIAIGKKGTEGALLADKSNRAEAAEARARAAADLAARRSRNPYDSADDFYKKPKAVAAAEAKAAEKDAADRAKTASDEKYKKEQDWVDKWKPVGTAIGMPGTAGEFKAVAGDGAASVAAMKAAAEARAQATAELKAANSENPFDSAEDFYVKPTMGIKDYTDALTASVEASKKWGHDVTTVTAGVGADVVAYLKGMGEDGLDWITKLSTGTAAEMAAVTDAVHKMMAEAFNQDVAGDIAAKSQFQGNLALLVGRGRSDLAARFASMGVDSAGGLAAAAAGMTDAELAAMAGQVATQDALDDSKLPDAIALAALLQAAGGKLGIVGLSQKSGKSISDVVGLLQSFDAQVFAKMPPGSLAQIRADQALLSQGKQPSGLEYGGIVMGSQTGNGLHYRWAEKGSGGESLIPLGQDRRQRALQIWEQTGRLIGGSMGGGGSMVVVQPGAVTVSVDASGQLLTEGQVKSIANDAANGAMSSLASKLGAGAR